jgi:hypothetical protein
MSRREAVELSCDGPGCSEPGIAGRTWDEVVADAETDGWLIDSDKHLCPFHRRYDQTDGPGPHTTGTTEPAGNQPWGAC